MNARTPAVNAHHPLGGVVRQLHRLLDHTNAPASDGELLAAFVAHRDEAAFAALVQRHGAMVLGVCRRVLRDGHAAEDAFQATFLVLLRRAAALDCRRSLAGWLHTVAYHTALRARASRQRRQQRQRELADAPARPRSAFD